METKTCKSCSIDKILSEYPLDKNAKDGHRIHCKSCCNEFKRQKRQKNPESFREYARKYLKEKPERKLFNSAQQRAKTNNLEFNLQVEDIVIPEVCPILGIKLITNSNVSGGENNSASIDRIDSTKGYTKDNIMVISRLANMMKSTATKEQLMIFAKWVLSIHEDDEDVSSVG